MDFKERLERLAERRGETQEDLTRRYEEWKAGIIAHSGEITDIVQSKDSADFINPVTLAEVIAETPDNQIEEVVDALGVEMYREYRSIMDEPIVSLSMEGYYESVNNIVKRLIEFIDRWIRVLATAETKLALTTLLYGTQIEEAKNTIRSTASGNKTGPFQIHTRLQNMCVNGIPLKDAQGLIYAMTIFQRAISGFYDTYTPELIKAVPEVITAVTNSAPIDSIASIVLGSGPMANVPLGIYSDRGTGERGSPPLLGNAQLVITDDGLNGSTVERVRGQAIVLDMSRNGNVELPQFISFQRFDQRTGQSLLERADALLTIISESNTTGFRMRRKNAMKALNSALARKRVEAGQNQVYTEDNISELAVLIESFVKWIGDTYVPLYSLTLRNVKAVINLCHLNHA